MLLPQPHRNRSQNPFPRLDTPEEIDLFVRREAALRAKAARRREEIAVKRDDFELIKSQFVFGIQLFVSVVSLVAIMVILVVHPDLIPVTLMGGGILRGALGLRRNGC